MGKTGYVRWIILAGATVILFLLDLSLGSVDIPLTEILRILSGEAPAEESWAQIVWEFRMTKALTCVLAGAALSLGGLQMQTLFRNALAGPDVLGLTSGASLSVSLILMSGASSVTFSGFLSAWSVAVAASMGCAAVFVLMLILSRRLQDNVSLLIVGLMVGAATSSLVSVLQYFSSADEMQVFIIWTFGSLGNLSWDEIKVLTAVIMVGLITTVLNLKALNAWLLGDHYTATLGINIKRGRMLSILSASLFTGAVTAFCGPIAFVGLAVPHLVKLLMETHDHKVLIPACLLGGSALLLGCDLLTHLPGSSSVLPINAITALFGAPVVIWVILRTKVIRS